MPYTLPLTKSKSNGKPELEDTHARICERCRVNIDNRHKNARFCIDCSDKKEKPNVVSCRLDNSTYERFKEKLNGLSKQKILESLILRYLNIYLVISICIFCGCLSGNNEPPEGFDDSRTVKFVAESFGSKHVFNTQKGELIVTFTKKPNEDGTAFCFLASLNEDRCSLCYFYSKENQFSHTRPAEGNCKNGNLYTRVTSLNPKEETGSLLVAWRE